MSKQTFIFILLLFSAVLVKSSAIAFPPHPDSILFHTIDPAKQNLQLFWKDDKGNNFRSLDKLQQWVARQYPKKELVFAMNGGMYMEDYRPLGLYIENGVEKKKINRATGYGNFYLMPNGIFYVTKKKTAGICETSQFKNEGILYATQSGPLLVINGKIHKEFKEGSKNLQIRNGVGILPDGRAIFAMSKTPVNFYDFAAFFKISGCKYALFLDGFVCRTYLPEKHWKEVDGDFGVIIASVEDKE